jgi:LPS-assembly protein
VRPFDPDKFTLDPADPRLNPSRVEFKPDLKLFDRNLLNPIIEKNISRHYAELAVDIRPPALEKTYTNEDGSTRFKHLIEPYITYRLIGGIGNEFNRIIRFDEADAVADTNEVEYAVVNRFFTKQLAADVTRKRPRIRRPPSGMKPVRPSDKENLDRDKQPPGQAENKGEAPKKSESAGEAKSESKSEPAQTAESKQKLETGQQQELNAKDRANQQKQAGTPRADNHEAAAPETANSENAAPQAYELLTIRVAQKYFFDRTFGGALIEGRRNQFYPINTMSGFTFGGRERAFSPLNLAVRYRPLSSVYADLRMDFSNDEGVVRNVIVGGGMRTDKVTVSASYYLSRQTKLPTTGFEPGTFPGDQVSATLQLGNDLRGLYGGSRMTYDFTDRFITDTQISRGRLMNSRSYIGYSWDCCGVQFNYSTFKAGLRNESAWSFTFTLAGLGSYGTDQFSQLGGGRGARKRGKRTRADDDYY